MEVACCELGFTGDTGGLEWEPCLVSRDDGDTCELVTLVCPSPPPHTHTHPLPPHTHPPTTLHAPTRSCTHMSRRLGAGTAPYNVTGDPHSAFPPPHFPTHPTHPTHPIPQIPPPLWPPRSGRASASKWYPNDSSARSGPPPFTVMSAMRASRSIASPSRWLRTTRSTNLRYNVAPQHHSTRTHVHMQRVRVHVHVRVHVRACGMHVCMCVCVHVHVVCTCVRVCVCWAGAVRAARTRPSAPGADTPAPAYGPVAQRGSGLGTRRP